MGEEALERHFLEIKNKAGADLLNALRETEFLSGRIDPFGENIGVSKESSTGAQSILNTLKRYQGWETMETDRGFLLEQSVRTMKELHKRVKSYDFDRKDIEKGYHELRRHLRRILIQIASLDGFVVLKEVEAPNKKVMAWFNEIIMADPEILNGKFVRFSAPVVENPLRIPLQHYLIVKELVAKIGDSKDVAETQIYFQEAMDELGFSNARRKHVLIKIERRIGSEAVDHRSLSRQTQDRLNETKLLKAFAETLEEMNQDPD
jgi:hypothetical protein